MDAPMRPAVKSVSSERKMVQEKAEAGGAPPTEYIVKESQRLADAPSLPTVPLPVIHLGQPNEAEEIKAALQSWGMYQVIDHGMPPSFLDELRDVGRGFFSLTIEEKQKYINIGDEQYGQQGYGNDEIMAEGQIRDWIDRLYLTIQPEDARKVDFWPTNPNSLRDVLLQFSMKTKKLVLNALKTTTKSLELSENSFVSHLGDKFSIMARFKYYPCCSKPDLVFGLRPHSDGSLITVILPDKDVGGLQVMKDGEWYKVITSPHALIFGMGDQMEIMSNGILKSPVHRVVTFLDKDRISTAIIFGNFPEKVIGPADELVNEMRPRMYKNVKVKDYIELSAQHFYQGKRGIDWVHIL